MQYPLPGTDRSHGGCFGGDRCRDRNQLVFVGYDAEEEEIEALSEGTISGLIVQNPYGMGYATVVAAARAALGQGNEAVVNTGYQWVTTENLETEEIQRILY